ncbi:hypothetical protein BDV38DRAFT_69152 [Aspergillus pseudotamarii]|uniref:Uncharacterized protein n=1 Tax=Aspergillus pseudotamarii TaxID=132259 RepID=A0A5N6SVD6_ASPPS|nr:uncharacterized protein BDV38DRAFT_69152 [Aspergillus pseudotamarii]KAE8138656.1 hypothetical protein BDV38DRAFT_69152 [Aspergillus pseudotamarii]
MPTSLLDLPNELLEQIVQLALTYDKPPPDCPQAPYEGHVSGPRKAPCRSWSYGPSHVKYWKKQDWQSGCPSLLLLNRRIAEIARRRLDLVPCSLRLDVILANETDLLPTWCFLSKVCRRVDDLTATFRIIGTSPTLEGRRQRFRPGYGTPPPILWSFYYILERFLEVGPLAEHRLPTASPRSKRMPFSINRLNLDFVSSKDGTVAPIRIGVFDWMNGIDNEDDVESCAWSYSDLASWLMRPEWLAEFISGYIRYLLRMGDRAELHGAMMYEYVGSIRICVDGNLLEEYRLDYILKDLNLTYGADETRRNSFVRWKAKAYRVRQEAGLPVIF